MATRSCKRTTEICSMYLFKDITRSVGRNGFVISFSYMLLLETSFSKWTTDFIISFFYTKPIAHPLYFPWLGTTAQRKESAHHVDCGQWLNSDFAVSVSDISSCTKCSQAILCSLQLSSKNNVKMNTDLCWICCVLWNVWEFFTKFHLN